MIQIPHLETDLTTACQLSCVACNHSVPLWRKAGPWFSVPADVEHDLTHLAPFLHAEKWGALGGEPLLHKDLCTILDIARASKIADAIEVWTNGLLVAKMPDRFWRSFDHLVHSLYPGKQTEAEIQWIVDACAANGVTYVPKDERRVPNFRTMLEPVPTDAAATAAKFQTCFFRHFSRSATRGFVFTCCCGPHIPSLIQGQRFGTDGIAIAGLTESALRAYLDRTAPLGACTVCAGRDTALPLVWREERDPAKWLDASAGR
jgi:hypothetical protein